MGSGHQVLHGLCNELLPYISESSVSFEFRNSLIPSAFLDLVAGIILPSDSIFYSMAEKQPLSSQKCPLIPPPSGYV